MECKSDCSKDHLQYRFELIETLWNVNNTTDVTNNSPCGELIETLWNVNTYKKRRCIQMGLGINRNIVECK